MSFKVGDEVEWTSQAQGYTTTKRGVVAEVVPCGGSPNRERFPHLYRSVGVGMPRGHESYVVMVGTRPYWPRANKLASMRARSAT